MTLRFFRFALIMAAALGLCAGHASAETFSYIGNLRTDANVTACGVGCTLGSGNTAADYAQWAAVVESFTVTSTSSMEAITFSNGGGTNAAGTTIPEGGFEPYLSLFDASGDFLASTLFGTNCPPGANANSVSGFCFDVALDGGVLSPGTYQIAISAFENLSFAENLGTGRLSDGFTGLGNLFPGEDLNFAFDVTLSPAVVSPVPEPSSLLFVATGCSLLPAFTRRLRIRRSH